jgi:hypothetical protein
MDLAEPLPEGCSSSTRAGQQALCSLHQSLCSKGSKRSAGRWITMLIRTPLIATCVLLWTIGPTLANEPPGLEGWRQISSDAQNKTREFRSPDGRAHLLTSQTRPTGNLSRDMDRIAYKAGERVTYQKRGLSWVAVSGYRGNTIFYRKSNLACHGTKWHNIEFAYPASNKRQLDRGVTAAARIMGSYSNRC